MRSIHWLAASVVLLLGPASPSSLQAEPITVYSTLASDGTYDANSGWVITTFGLVQEIAAGFSPSAESRLISLGLALGSIAPLFGTTAEVFLMSDSGGVPGAVIEAFTVGTLPAMGASNTALVRATSARHPLLLPGTNYWVVATMPDGSAAWNVSTLPGASILQRIERQDWHRLSPGAAFEVQATVVPEPATLTFITLGLVSVGARFVLRTPVRTAR